MEKDIFIEDGIEYYSYKNSTFELVSFPHLKENNYELHRLPISKYENLPENVVRLSGNSSGGFLRFMTNSKRIAIKAKLSKECRLNFMPRTGMYGFDIYAGCEKDREFIGGITCKQDENEIAGIKDISKQCGMFTEITVYFPLYNGISELYIGIDEGAKITKPLKFDIEKPIVFYGSSVTMGGCVSRPGLTYTSILSRWLNANMYNLGFAGNAKGEIEVAEIIADIDMSMFIYDYDHNAPDPMHLVETYYPFYKVIRDKNKDIPIFMVSKFDFYESRDQDKLRRKIIKNAYKHAKAEGDQKVYFIDGAKAFGDFGRDECTVDRCHPNSLGSVEVAKYLYKEIVEALNIEDNLIDEGADLWKE